MARDKEAALLPDRDRLRWLINWLVLLAVLVHPTQKSINLLAGAEKQQLNLCVVDLVLGFTFGLWMLRRIMRKEFSLPPLSIFALAGVIWMGLSLALALRGSATQKLSLAPRTGLVKVFQFFEYFIIAHTLFAEAFTDKRWRKRGLVLLGLITLGVLILGAAQYFRSATPVLGVRGSWFTNRNTFGVFLAMTLPLLWGLGLFGRCKFILVGVAAMVAIGLCVCLSGGAVLAICIGVLTVAALRGKPAFVATAIILVVIMGVVLPRLPRKNSKVLLDSVLLYKQSDPYAVFGPKGSGNTIEKIKTRNQAKRDKLRQRRQCNLALSEEDLSWKWQQRCKEWQAAVNMMANRPFFGVGAGGYQGNVGSFYFGLPKISENLMEPDALSGYMVWGASAGVPFLFILFGMFAQGAISSIRAFVCESDGAHKALAAGLAGSLAGVLVVTFFSSPFVRGLGVTLALVLALAHALHLTSSKASRPKETAAS